MKILTTLILLSLVFGVLGSGCNKTIRTSRRLRIPKTDDENVDLPMNCFYHLVNYGGPDHIFELSIQSMDLGKQDQTTGKCVGGHLKVIEETTDDLGLLKATREIGRFCGKSSSNSFFRYANSLHLFYYTDSGRRNQHVRIRTSVIPKKLAEDRYPALAESTNSVLPEYVDCDKLIKSCNKAGCTITSPGYPGSYLRGITCRYYVSFPTGFQVVVGGMSSDVIDVGMKNEDCKKCDKQSVCQNDRISVYEGRHELTEEIGRFCGKGSVPKVVSRSNEVVIEFHALENGKFHKGFHLTVQQQPIKPSDEIACEKIIRSDSNLEGYIRPLRHWYPSGFHCQLRILGKASERIWFQANNKHKDEKKISDPGDKKVDKPCSEKWSIYDVAEIGKELIATFCGDGHHDSVGSYSSRSNEVIVEFTSVQGSLSGSSSDFSLFYLFYNETSGGIPQEPPCDEVFMFNSTTTRSSVSLLQNRLLLRAKSLTCKYTFKANDNERVRLTLKRIKLDPIRQCVSPVNANNAQCLANNERNFDLVQILDTDGDTLKCTCLSSSVPTVYWSTGNTATVIIELNHIYSNSFKDRSLYRFDIEVEGVENYCGSLDMTSFTGKLQFPNDQVIAPMHELDCAWKVDLPNEYLPVFKISQLILDKYCKESFLSFTYAGESEPYMRVCTQNQNLHEVLPAHWGEPSPSRRASKVLIRLHSVRARVRLRLRWTAVTPRWILSSNDSKTIHENEQCEFRCKDGVSCIPKALACDGVIDCPQVSYLGEPLDEAPETCILVASREYVHVNWTVPVLSIATLLVVILFTVLCCRKSRVVNNVGVSTLSEKHYL